VSNGVEGFEEVVRARAYAIWESEGRPNGRDAEHWLRSMEEVRRLRLAQAAKPETIQSCATQAPAKAKKDATPKAKKNSKKH
jgi:hypothetical protein